MIALNSSPWEGTAAERQDQINAAIPLGYRVDQELLKGHNLIDLPRKSGILTAREIQITESRAIDLVDQLRGQTYSAVEVTTAFCKRAAIAHQAVSWIFRRAFIPYH